MTKTAFLKPDANGLGRGAALLSQGQLVAFATETVYGLGADATDARAVARVYAAKGRPSFNPLICHYASAAAAFEDVVASPMAVTLADAFWPGPLTMVLPRRPESKVALLAGAGLDTLAVRVPRHPDALALLEAVARPVAAPSANTSGQLSPTEAGHVMAGLGGKIDAVLDSGACPVGVESTVLDLTGPEAVLLRPGGLALEAIERLIGPVVRGAGGAAELRSPGLLASHYAPHLTVRLDAISVTADEGLLAFGAPLPGAGAVFNLSEQRDLVEAASRLFAGLHWLDASGQERGHSRIAAMTIPKEGLGLAIHDRLTRASAPRVRTDADDKRSEK